MSKEINSTFDAITGTIAEEQNDPETYKSFGNCWEMIDIISRFGTDDDISKTRQVIGDIAKKHSMYFPYFSNSLHQMLDLFFFVEEAKKSVFDEIHSDVKGTYIDVLSQLTLSINQTVIESMKYAGFEEREAKEYLDSFIMGI